MRAVVGYPVPAVRLDKLRGDASERNFYRLYFNRQQSLVLMEFDPPQPDRQAKLVQVWEYFNRWNLGVPKLYYHHQQQGWLFFEDCGDLSLERLVREQPADVYYPYYEQAVELLLRIQQAGIRHEDPDCPAFQAAFDAEKLSWELDFFLKYMLEEHRRIKLPPADKQKLQNHFRALGQRLAAEPRCLTHRDYHSRNLIIKDGRIRLVDFQDARLGLCQYDLASLLRDSYVQLNRQQVDNLMEYYIRGKEKQEGRAIDRRRFRQVFDYTCIQRNLKAVGTFAYLACWQGKPSYLRFIPPTLEYVRQNLNTYPELKDFQQLLGKYLPEVNQN
jgi:hypothetical protein